MDKPMTFIEWCSSNGKIPYSVGIEEAYEGGQQSMQAKVEELKASHHGEVIGHEVHFKKIKQERDELQTLYTQQGINMLKLQKRVDALSKRLSEATGLVVEELEQALKGEGQ